MSQTVLRLTNYDDWEAYYLFDNDTWILAEQGHHVRVKDLLALFDISVDTYEVDFQETGFQAPPEVDEELMKKIEGQDR